MNLLRRQSSTHAREMRVKESAKAWVSSELEAKATKTFVRVIRSALPLLPWYQSLYRFDYVAT
jgi:hypothetical protein